LKRTLVNYKQRQSSFLTSIRADKEMRLKKMNSNREREAERDANRDAERDC